MLYKNQGLFTVLLRIVMKPGARGSYPYLFPEHTASWNRARRLYDPTVLRCNRQLAVLRGYLFRTMISTSSHLLFLPILISISSTPRRSLRIADQIEIGKRRIRPNVCRRLRGGKVLHRRRLLRVGALS